MSYHRNLKFKKGLLVGSFNPLHEGHEYLFQLSKRFCTSTDIYIGIDKNDYSLPREVRATTIQDFIIRHELSDKFNITASGTNLDLDRNKYSVLVAGSDVLNLIAEKYQEKSKPYEIPNILYANRKEMPLTDEARKNLTIHTNLIEVLGISNISGSKIRQASQEGKDISKLVSKNTWRIIKDYAYLLGK